MSDRARVPAELRAAGPLDAPIEEEDDLNLDAGIMIRDMRTNERFWVHDTVIDDYGPLLGADAFTIYCSLCCMANKAQYCWPSLVRLARHWGKGKTTVSRAVTLLTDLHLVHVKRTQREDGGTSNNIYYLLEPLPLDEGLAHLLAALQARGASPQEAVERAMALLPDNWEPLRRKKTALKARSDWSALMASIVGRSTSGPGQSASEPARSATGPGGTGPGQGESSTGTGGTGVERGVSAEDRGELERNGAGSITERDGYGAGPAPFPDGTAPVPPREPKVTPVEGSPGNQTQEGDQHQGPGGGVTLQTDDEIRQYPLGDDEVLLETEDGHAEPIAIRELVQRDIEATAKNWGVRVWTDCFYSADHFLGIGGETWSPDEERRQAYHAALRRDLDALYRDTGAFSIAEALAAYFTNDLVRRFDSDDPAEQQRLRAWLRYVRGDAGRGLENPAGFLRGKLESGQWPPRNGAASRRPGKL